MTKTIRSVPENYWIASVGIGGKPIFDSWDGAIKGKICKTFVRLMWGLGLITVENGLSPAQIEQLKNRLK